jgi:release factor glutamine methyltransferase
MTKTISSLIKFFSIELQSFYNTAKQDIQSIFCAVLDVDTTYLYLNDDKSITDIQFANISEMVAKYKNGEPLAYVLGYKYFWNQKLIVNEHTLIPRADTEVLIEIVLADFLNKEAKLSILDLGTGTGAIALALADEYINSKVIAVDFSDEALKIAKQNAELNDISNIEFIQSNWYSSLSDMQFDIIVSNPPYIDVDDTDIDSEVAKHEPSSALFAANNGLSDIFKIVNGANKYLKNNGAIYIEHGYTQSKDVQDILANNGFEDIKTFKDLNDKDRCTKGCLKS